MRRPLLALLILVICKASAAQIEVAHLSVKGFNATGFGGFFNFAVPVSDADYVTAELGLNAFSSNGNNIATAPIVAGYRYTFNRAGDGFYVEPNAGYGVGATDIQLVDASGIYRDANISGLATGVTLGYLFQPTGRIQFNLGIRYEHIFGSDMAPNVLSFRISHAFTFGRRDSSY